MRIKPLYNGPHLAEEASEPPASLVDPRQIEWEVLPFSFHELPDIEVLV